MEGRLREPLRLSGGGWLVTFTTGADAGKLYDRLKDADVEIEIRKHNPKRSRDANAMCWAMCSDIGNALRPPLPKEEVYRRAIREVGEYEPLPIREDAVETFRRRWAEKGTGWFAEVLDDSVFSGFKQVAAYFGSSTYDTRQMSRLLDYLLEDARLLGISIPLGRNELDRLIGDWHMKRKEAEP